MSKPNLGIASVETVLPPNLIDNYSRASSLNYTSEQISQKLGFRKLARLPESMSTLQLAIMAVEKIIKSQNISHEDIQALIVVSQNKEKNIPHLSAEIHGHFKLNNSCACFDISLGCSGYTYALSIIKSFMMANGLSTGLIVTVDPYSSIINQEDRSTALIFGDGASATLIATPYTFEIGCFEFGTFGAEADKITLRNDYLSMNGRAVFNFCATVIPPHIKHTLQKNNIPIEDVDLFLLHQGSKYIVETIASRLGVDFKKVPFVAGEYGNLVSSSIPFALDKYFNSLDCRNILLSGFGLGLSWSSVIIKRDQ